MKPYVRLINCSDAESVEQQTRKCSSPSATEICFATVVGIHSLALIAPYAILFVAVSDKRFMNLATAEKEKIAEICERNDIEFCALFGSFARGEATETCDIDLLVRFSKTIGLFGFVGVEQELEEALGRKVDLATDKMIGKYIRESVFRDLKIIYEKARQPAATSTYSLSNRQNKNLSSRL